MWMGRKARGPFERCRPRAMCSAEASCPQPSQGKSVRTAIYKNVEQGRGRGKCAKGTIRAKAQMARGLRSRMVRGKNPRTAPIG